jgi:ABC-type branched-subunit amino acid transport system permease subunit
MHSISRHRWAFGGIGTLFGPLLGAVVSTIFDEVLIEFGQLRVVTYES